MGDKSTLTPALVPVTAFGLAAGACWYFDFRISYLNLDASASLGGTLASVGATMLGFLLASLAVLASINHTHLIGMMRQTGHYADLLATIFYSCLTFLACAVVGFILAFGYVPSFWFSTLVVAVHAAALASILDVGRKFWFVLTNLRTG